jgi:uncharacterized repeat protein (TIGR03803 family)
VLFSSLFLFVTACSGGTVSPQVSQSTVIHRSSGTVGDDVIHSFSSTGGMYPMGTVAAQLTSPSTYTFYGTTPYASNGDGTVFKYNSTSFSTIFTFPSDGSKGAEPIGVIVDSSGALYGTTFITNDTTYGVGGGTVYKLTPSGSTYTYSDLHTFASKTSDGDHPIAALIEDSSGNLYGTTAFGGIYVPYCDSSSGTGNEILGCGTVFELSHSGSGYSYNVIYRFAGATDGQISAGCLLLDSSGNLYGTTAIGGSHCETTGQGCGTVYKLQPTHAIIWSKTTLHNFAGGSDGSFPTSALAADSSGSLFGTTLLGGAHNCGTIFKLHPNGSGGYTESVLHSFVCGAGIISGLSLAEGELWGTHQKSSGSCCGAIFETDPSSGSTSEAYEFQGHPTDGAGPVAPPYGPGYPTGRLLVVPKAVTTLYGVTISGGSHSSGCSGSAGSGSGSFSPGCGTFYSFAISSGAKSAKERSRKAAFLP